MQGFVRDVLAVSALALATCAASAQPYPSRNVEIVVSYAPGGSTDLVARTLAQKFQEALGQSCVVINRPGGGGQIAPNQIARGSEGASTKRCMASKPRGRPNVISN